MNMAVCAKTAATGGRPFVSRIFAAALIAVVLGGFAASAAHSGGQGEEVPERIEAQALLLKDAGGRLWGILGMAPNQEPMLSLNDSQNKDKVIVALMDHPDTPNYALLQVTCGEQFVELGTNSKWGPFLHVTDRAGNPRIVFSTKAQESLGGLVAKWGKGPWPTILTTGPDGGTAALLLVTPTGGISEAYNARHKCIFHRGAQAQ